MPYIETKYITTLITKIVSSLEIKIIIGVFVYLLGFLFDGLLYETMFALLLLIIFDFITGVYANKKRGKIISSRKIFRSALKTTIYFVLISAGHLTEKAMGEVLPLIDETTIGFLAVTELISIIENVGDMGYAVPKKLLNRLKEFRDKK